VTSVRFPPGDHQRRRSGSALRRGGGLVGARPAGFVTFSESTLCDTCALAGDLGLPFHDAKTVRLPTDERAQRQRLRTSGVDSTASLVPPHRVQTDFERATDHRGEWAGRWLGPGAGTPDASQSPGGVEVGGHHTQDLDLVTGDVADTMRRQAPWSPSWTTSRTGWKQADNRSGAWHVTWSRTS